MPNRTWDEIRIGDEAEIRRTCTADDIFLFAHVSGDLNPLHLPASVGEGEADRTVVAPSMWAGSLLSAVLGNMLPGPGTLYLGQSLDFKGRVKVGDEVRVHVRVTAREPERVVRLACTIELADGTPVATGEARVIAPAQRIDRAAGTLPELMLRRHDKFEALFARARALPALRTAVAWPCDKPSLEGALRAAQEGLIAPVLIGPAATMRAVADSLSADLSGCEIVECASPPQSAALAVEFVHSGRVQAVMKGSLHSDELLHHVTKADGGLRTARRISHAFVMDVPGLKQLLTITDAAINILPSLEAKVDIVQNAIDLAIALGIEQPRVGILSAVETVTPKIPSTIDAAVLAKMAERGQIKGGLVDGPLAMDNAMDLEAARTKGITSLVAGRADILVVPSLEAGNMLAKELTFLTRADAAGLVLGAKVPVMLTSRADDARARLASCALAVLAGAAGSASRAAH